MIRSGSAPAVVFMALTAVTLLASGADAQALLPPDAQALPLDAEIAPANAAPAIRLPRLMVSYGDDVHKELRRTNFEGPVLALQGASEKTVTRGSKRIAIGAAIGGGAGVVVGEYIFGRYLDLPHGPDMLLGGGMGAGVGALIAWLTGDRSGTSRPKSSLSVAPVVSPSHKALLVTLNVPKLDSLSQVFRFRRLAPA